jgi:flavodoxin
MTKILIAYYSRTGTTKKVAEILAQKIGAEIEEIKDTVNRSGVLGYLASGRDAMKKSLTQLEPIKCNPTDFDMVIVGTPNWARNMSTPIRTYLTQQKNNFKSVAFFCTMGGSGDEKAFKEMGELIGKNPIGTLSLKTREVAQNNFMEKIDSFLIKVK